MAFEVVLPKMGMTMVEGTITEWFVQNGDTVTESIVDGKAVVLFFGYTHCPDYCPMTLTLLAQAMNTLSEQEREQLRVLFISVDPERDTPALLKEYTDYFGPEVIGLTGSKDQLELIT